MLYIGRDPSSLELLSTKAACTSGYERERQPCKPIFKILIFRILQGREQLGTSRGT